MKLKSLKLENFKGTKYFVLEADGKNLNIYGDNAVGKTTIADAYFWLLTGKNFAGSTNFEVFPHSAPDGTDAAVTGVFTLPDGSGLTLLRVLSKNFVRKNGEAFSEYKGNKTAFYVNGAPKLQKDYAAAVEKYFGNEKTFSLFSDPDYFAGKMAWKDRREILIKTFAPNTDDRDIIAAHEELSPLSNWIGAMTTVEELAAQIAAERRNINSRLADIPGRIDENEKSRPLITAPDVSMIPSLAKKKMELQVQISKLTTGGALADAQRRLSEKQGEIAKAEFEYNRSNSDNDDLKHELNALNASLAETTSELTTLRMKSDNYLKFSQSLADELDKLRKKCMMIHAEQFDSALETCPYCGQPMPPEKTEEAREHFNTTKVKRLEEAKAEGVEKKELMIEAQKNAEATKLQVDDTQKLIDVINRKIESAKAQIVDPIPFSQTLEYQAMSGQMNSIKQEISVLETSANQQAEKLKDALGEIDDKISETKNAQAAVERNKDIDERIKELMDEESRLGQMLAQKENLLQLTEKFIQLQTADIEDKVNGAFEKVRWKLFDKQVNGGIKPCCEATVEDIPYSNNLNSGDKINAGLDIINTLGKVNNVDLPIFIDNAESVTKYIDVSSQFIRLYVSAADKQLRVEVAE